jgi:hypothetical protein
MTSSGGDCISSRVAVTVTLIPIPDPTNLTVSSDPACQNSEVELSAVAAGATINWYTDAIGGTSIGDSPSGGSFTITPTTAGVVTYYAEAMIGGSSGAVGSFTDYSYSSGTAQQAQLQSGTYEIECWGADGGKVDMSSLVRLEVF